MPRTVNVDYVTKEVNILLHDSETESLAAATAVAAADSAQTSSISAANSASTADSVATALTDIYNEAIAEGTVVAPAVDPTLTISGAAADAKVVGGVASVITPKYVQNEMVNVSGKFLSNNGRMRSEYIPCKEGVVVTYIAETDHSNISALTFYDANKETLQTNVNVGTLGNEFTATAPANTDSFVVSSKPTYTTYIKVSEPYLLNDDFSVRKLNGIVDGLFSALTFTAGHFISTPSIGSTLNPTMSKSPAYECLIVPCKKGDVFNCNTSGGTPVAWCLTDVDYTVLDEAVANTVVNKPIYALQDGFFVANNKVSYTSRYVQKSNGRIDDVESRLNNISISTDNIVDDAVTPPKTSFMYLWSFNMMNPADYAMNLYWSPGSSAISSGYDAPYALSGLIEVEEGETYTISDNIETTHSYIGGFFVEGAVQQAGQTGTSATFFRPVSGRGYCFTVPAGIKYFAVNLHKSNGEVPYTYQLERGEMATEIVPYNPMYKIDEDYLPPQETVEKTSSIVELPSVAYDSVDKAKIEKFRNHCRLKDKDIVVVGTGTSLTARSSEHCTLRADASTRPPLMHSNNFASDMWDRMRWEGQQYRRYDVDGFFTETGTFTTSSNLSDWDDANYRDGLTRYATAPASVAFTIPTNAWQFNFIYRSDTAGSGTVTVTVAEGNGKVEVYNGTTWVEANGYTFSMRQSTVSLSNIDVYNPNTVGNTTVHFDTYQVGGNTTYQKRLKMRCKSTNINSLSETKSITISASTGRLLYWGVEWSAREHMITYINSARGSHSLTYDSERCLCHYQDNEIWDFKPDLIFTENPIHNSGGSGTSLAGYYTTYWGYATYDFFFNTDNPISLSSRAVAKGLSLTDIEWVVFTSSITWNFTGINDDGELKIYIDKSGNGLSALDAQTLCHEWILENKTDALSINACKYWCDAGSQLFGDLKTATQGSGKGGATFTNEGSHWNNTGSAVMARCMGGVFDLYV